jgi:hypothetical protein
LLLLQKEVVHTKLIGMFMHYLLNYIHLARMVHWWSSSDRKKNIYIYIYLLHSTCCFISQKKKVLWRKLQFLKCYHLKFQDHTFEGAVVTPKSEVHTYTLLMFRQWKRVKFEWPLVAWCSKFNWFDKFWWDRCTDTCTWLYDKLVLVNWGQYDEYNKNDSIKH